MGQKLDFPEKNLGIMELSQSFFGPHSFEPKVSKKAIVSGIKFGGGDQFGMMEAPQRGQLTWLLAIYEWVQ